MERPEVMSVKELIEVLQNSIKAKTINLNDKIYLSTDEEGNSYSPLTMDGIMIGSKNRINFYPIYPQMEE